MTALRKGERVESIRVCTHCNKPRTQSMFIVERCECPASLGNTIPNQTENK